MTNTTNTNNVVNSVTFERELNYIKNEKLRNFTGYVLDKLPDYFREIGASSSGKYHPSYTLGAGGVNPSYKGCHCSGSRPFYSRNI